MIVMLGDIHFSSSKDYFIEIGEQFLAWYATWQHNNESNELLLTGDLVQSAVNAGIVVEFLHRFFSSSRFHHIHIVEGNHDKKKKDGLDQLAYSFAAKLSNVTIYSSLTEITIENHPVLLLPYYLDSSMVPFYSSLHTMKQYQKHYDLVVGHFADFSAGFLSTECVDNLDKLDTGKICLGHIHNRINQDIYIGSVYANRVNENGTDRAAWLMESSGAVFEDPLPVFGEFLTVNYPDPLPLSNALVPVYTVTNCSSEAVARDTYGNIFIRKTLQDISQSTFSSDTVEAFNLCEQNVEDLFSEFIKGQQPAVDRRVAGLCRELLANATNYNNGKQRDS